MPPTPFYSSEHFYIGLLIGVLGACYVCWKLWSKDKTGSSPITITGCSEIPTDPAQVRRIGTASARTTEETDDLQKLLDDFEAKFVPAGTDPLEGFLGGRIEKCALAAILGSADPKQQFISYKLGLDSDNKVILLLNGGYYEPFATSTSRFEQPLVLFNGTDKNLFCPKQCDRDRWLLT